MKRDRICCRRCMDYIYVQGLELDAGEKSTCKSCKTEFFGSWDGHVYHVFKRGRINVPRERRKRGRWALDPKVFRKRRVIYLSCPWCGRVLKEYAHKVDPDGSVFRTNYDCFSCECRMHFWAKLDGWSLSKAGQKKRKP